VFKSPKIATPDGHEVIARHYDRGMSNLLIASHGIDSEKTEGGIYEQLSTQLAQSHDALLFDFRGHGESAVPPVEATIAGEILDLMAVLNWAKLKRFKQIDHVASSFGASITVLAADAYGIGMLRRVVFWNPVVNYRMTFTHAATEWGRSFFDQERIADLATRKATQIADSSFLISSLMTQELLVIHPEVVRWPPKIPALILHGELDTAVPVNASRNFAKLNGIQFEMVAGVDHGFDDKIDIVIRRTCAWLCS
jgi:pimeloyl-ACP methyl ester carboxylesterase